MSNRSLVTCRTWILAAALVVATGGAASVGRTQQLSGSIGVSLTILEPVSAPQIFVTGFEIGRDGVARFETMLPRSSGTSQLVMARVSSSTTGFTPEAQAPVLVAPTSGVTRMRYRVSLGGNHRSDRPRPTELRVEYLVVAAGT